MPVVEAHRQDANRRDRLGQQQLRQGYRLQRGAQGVEIEGAHLAHGEYGHEQEKDDRQGAAGPVQSRWRLIGRRLRFEPVAVIATRVVHQQSFFIRLSSPLPLPAAHCGRPKF